MLDRPYFYNAALKKYMQAFTYIFSKIYIQREDATGAKVQEMRVPITYAPKHHWFAKQEFVDHEDQDGDLLSDSTKRPVAAIYPRMAFDIRGIVSDPERRLPATTRFCVPSATGGKDTVYAPSPWNIILDLNIITKNTEDGNKILEQVLAFFNPTLTVSMKLIPGMPNTFDIPMTLNDISVEDTYDGNISDNRLIVWTLSFTMRAQFFGVVTQNVKPIKIIYDELYIPSGPFGEEIQESDIGNTPITGLITIRPGLTANGQPTTDANNSVPITNIEADDDYGIIEVYDEWPVANT